jgi:hypothetical protein
MVLLSGKSVKYSCGQAALLVLLAMSVALVIALSVMSRSVTDISTSSKSEDSSRAFNAAEAGVEQALLAGGTPDIGTTGNLSNGSSFFVKSTPVLATAQGVVLDPNYLSGDTAILWLINHDDNGNFLCNGSHPCFTGNSFDVCWGDSSLTPLSSPLTPAVEISVYYGTPGLIQAHNYSDVKVARMAADQHITRRNSNNFGPATSTSCSIDSKSFRFRRNINLGGIGIPASSRTNYGLLFVAVRFFYNTLEKVPVGILLSGGSLPAQGINIKSTGSVSDITRQVEAFRSFAMPPSIFDSAIFSFGAITQG